MADLLLTTGCFGSCVTTDNVLFVTLQRAQARQAKAAKGATSKGDPNARREADAKALQEKIAKKAAMKAEGGNAGATAPAKKK